MTYGEFCDLFISHTMKIGKTAAFKNVVPSE